MDSPVRRLAAAIVLPEATALPLVALQQKHGLPPWVPAIPLHVTLVSPFTTRETADAMAARWAPVAAGRAPFPVRIQGFGRFDNEQSVFFACVVVDEQLSRFADDALAACADLRQKRSKPFVPHVTLAMPSPREVVDDYLLRLAPDAPDLSFTCDRFHMLRLNEEAHHWDILRDFPFSP